MGVARSPDKVVTWARAREGSQPPPAHRRGRLVLVAIFWTALVALATVQVGGVSELLLGCCC